MPLLRHVSVRTPDRRSVLAGAAAVVATTARAQTPVPVRVGYVPVIGAAPLFVLAGEGWAREAGLALALTKFESGPPAIQALASGTLDILFVGVAPIAVARSKGLPVRIVAASGIGGNSFTVQPALAISFEAAGGDPKQAFASFRAKTGRPTKIATLPPGGTPTVALRRWFRDRDVRPEDVAIVAMGIEAVQQAMLSGAVDGGTVLEPSVTIVRRRNPEIKVIAHATAMYPNLPGVVVSATDAFAAAQPAAVTDLVRLSIRAQELIARDPVRAAPHVGAVLGGGLVPDDVFADALRSPAVIFVTDPRAIVDVTRDALAFEVEIGDFPVAPSIEGLFDATFYRRATGQTP